MSDFDQVVAAPPGRFDGIERPYSVEDVLRLRGSVPIEHTLARRGALRLWELLHQRRARARARRGDRQPGDADGPRRPQGDLSLGLAGRGRRRTPPARCIPTSRSIPANTGPSSRAGSTRRSQRADQIEHIEGGAKRDWFAPIVADAEAGFGGPLNCFEIMKAYIEAGAAGVHFEDQLASEKKCGHLGGKVLIPTQAAIRNLDAARARRRRLRRSDHPRRPHRRREREAHHQRRRRARPPVPHRRAHARRLLPPAGRHRPRPLHRPRAGLRRRTPTCCGSRPAIPNLDEARQLRRRRSTRDYPGKLLAYNCSPSFNWAAKLDEADHRQLPARARRDGLQVPVRHSGRLPQPQPRACSSWLRATATAAWRLIRSSSRPSSRARPRATPRPATSARSAPAISTRSRPPISGGQARPSRSSESTEAAQFAHPGGRGRVRRRDMGQRYWVIGGDYADCQFEEI